MFLGVPCILIRDLVRVEDRSAAKALFTQCNYRRCHFHLVFQPAGSANIIATRKKWANTKKKKRLTIWEQYVHGVAPSVRCHSASLSSDRPQTEYSICNFFFRRCRCVHVGVLESERGGPFFFFLTTKAENIKEGLVMARLQCSCMDV